MFTKAAFASSSARVEDKGYANDHEQESEDDAVVLLGGAVKPGDNHGVATLGCPGGCVKDEGTVACLWHESASDRGMPKPIHCIVAIAPDGAIGAAGRLAWDIPEDTRYFQAMTEGGVMIEGPVCYKELGKPLPARGTVVIARAGEGAFPGAEVVATMSEAVALAQSMPWPGPIWITGGERVYAEGLPLCERLYVTRVGMEIKGDRFFPKNWEQAFPTVISQRFSRQADTVLSFEVRTR